MPALFLPSALPTTYSPLPPVQVSQQPAVAATWWSLNVVGVVVGL